MKLSYTLFVPFSSLFTLCKVRQHFGSVHCSHSDSLITLPSFTTVLPKPTASDNESDVSVMVITGSGTGSGGLDDPVIDAVL